MGIIYDIAVIGGGAAGSMAFLRSVLNADNTVLFTGDADSRRRARATWVSEVDNIPGLFNKKNPVSALTNDTIKWISHNPQLKDKGTIIKSRVERITKENNLFQIYYKKNGSETKIEARFVIVATGVMDIQPHIQGKIEPVFPYANRNDLIYCVRCDGHRTIGKKLSIIGNKTPALAIGAMMKERYGHQQIFILTNALPEDFSEKFLKIANCYGFEFIREPIREILGDPKKEGLSGYRFANGRVIESNVSIVSLGVIVYNELLSGLTANLDEEGRVKVDKNFETSIENLFAIGDLASGKKMQIYTAWDEAVDAADEINRRIRMEKRELLLANFK